MTSKGHLKSHSVSM